MITPNTVAITQGRLMLFSDHESGGEMWTGSGPREVARRITFDAPFDAPPAVHAGLSLIDISNSDNLRADLSTDDIDATGFTVRFRTWGDTKVARMRCEWLAIGAARDPDRWAVD